MENKVQTHLIVAGVILVCGFLWFFFDGKDIAKESAEHPDITTMPMESEEAVAQTADRVYIHISGAVKKPGVYIFDEKPRVVEVVERAGGFKKGADESAINQAEILEDGVHIQISSRIKKKKTAATDEQQRDDGEFEEDLVNLNTATKEELMTLVGIGESKAVAILSYRETNGNFDKIEDIMNITGIKHGVFDKIKDSIKV